MWSYHPAPGNKPIIVGHNYSVLAGLPEKDDKTSPSWVIPLLIRRVPTNKKATDVGAVQLEDLLKDKELPFGSHLSSAVGDSTYSACEFIGQVLEGWFVQSPIIMGVQYNHLLSLLLIKSK